MLIFATDKEAMDRAIQEVELCTAEIEVGKTYRGIVRGIKEFGAFVECLPGKEGLVHISELADFRVKKTEDICKLGDEMVVKCIGMEKGKVRLSRKAALEDAKDAAEDAAPEGHCRRRVSLAKQSVSAKRSPFGDRFFCAPEQPHTELTHNNPCDAD